MSIVISNVKKSFSGTPLFYIPSLVINEGFTCIGGPSGCGKTTLGRIIAGLEASDCGEITGISGQPTILFQDSRLLPSISAINNVKDVCRTKESKALANELLIRLGFTPDDLRKHTSELSGGMIRRVAIARAIAFAIESEGNFVLLDEPFSGLDPETKAKAAEILTEHLSDKHVLVITHDEDDTELLHGNYVRFSDIANNF